MAKIQNEAKVIYNMYKNANTYNIGTFIYDGEQVTFEEDGVSIVYEDGSTSTFNVLEDYKQTALKNLIIDVSKKINNYSEINKILTTVNSDFKVQVLTTGITVINDSNDVTQIETINNLKNELIGKIE